MTRRAEPIDRLERNWQKDMTLIDEKSRNNRLTEAETIDGLKRNEEQKQSTD